MVKLPKKPKPSKPSAQIWRPFSGSVIRVVIESGVPQPRWLSQLIVK